MIPTPARQPQHCDHECVCGYYRLNQVTDRPCLGTWYPCCGEHDTRTSPQAPAERIPPCKDCPVETPHCRKNCRYYEMYVLGAKAEREQVRGVCAWTENESSIFITSCGHEWEFFDGDPEDNGISFCPFCGKSLRAQQGGVSERQHTKK